MKQYPFNPPQEETGYCLFDKELEDDPLILFHITPEENVMSIRKHGFKFMSARNSTSYAKKSSACLTYRGQNVAKNAVLVVRFETLDMEGINNNISDIHVRNESIQPEIIGIMIIPKDYEHR